MKSSVVRSSQKINTRIGCDQFEFDKVNKEDLHDIDQESFHSLASEKDVEELSKTMQTN